MCPKKESFLLPFLFLSPKLVDHPPSQVFVYLKVFHTFLTCFFSSSSAIFGDSFHSPERTDNVQNCDVQHTIPLQTALCRNYYLHHLATKEDVRRVLKHIKKEESAKSIKIIINEPSKWNTKIWSHQDDKNAQSELVIRQNNIIIL